MARTKFENLLVAALCFLSLLFSISLAQSPSCSNHHFLNGRTFSSCNDLPALGCSLHWNFFLSTRRTDVAFRCSGVDDSSWIAWAVNPSSRGMVGSQAFVLLRRTDGSLEAYTSPVADYATRLELGNLSFPVYDVSAAADSTQMTIFANFQVPDNTTINHVWQVGPMNGNLPGRHRLSGASIMAYGTLDLGSGKIATTSGKSSFQIVRLVHGILNAISWGFLMPIGALIARYLKRFEGADPLWFHLHRACQGLATLMGLAGAGLGFWLGHNSRGVRHRAHGNIGIALICFVLGQVVVAIFFRPNKERKIRFYWNMFHYVVGYATILMSFVNVFLGIKIFGEGMRRWEIGYGCVLGGMGVAALLLEVFAWKKRNSKKQAQDNNDSQDKSTVEAVLAKA